MCHHNLMNLRMQTKFVAEFILISNVQSLIDSYCEISMLNVKVKMAWICIVSGF